MVSKYGVAYDLRESPYRFTWRGMTFHFSSESHRKKFVDGVRARELWLRDSLSRRFHCPIRMDELASVQFYGMVETRGFYMVTNQGREYTAQAQVRFVPDLDVLRIGAD